LAGLLLHRHNVLLLDEPTNHLDAETAESLAHALTQYHGTVFFVSHSRTFVNMVATRLLDVRDGRLRQYPGSYEEYVDDLKESLRHETEGATPDVVTEQRTQERKRVRQELQELRRRASRIEKRLADIEAERGKLLLFFFDNPTDYDPDRRRTLAELEETLHGEEQQWLAIQETIERYEAES
jgi:ATP-binding cassette subfamily F protein 3